MPPQGTYVAFRAAGRERRGLYGFSRWPQSSTGDGSRRVLPSIHGPGSVISQSTLSLSGTRVVLTLTPINYLSLPLLLWPLRVTWPHVRRPGPGSSSHTVLPPNVYPCCLFRPDKQHSLTFKSE